MLTAYCPRHGARVLLSERHIRNLHNTPDGVVLEVECHDGERIMIVTGRAATEGSVTERVARARRAIAAARDPVRAA